MQMNQTLHLIIMDQPDLSRRVWACSSESIRLECQVGKTFAGGGYIDYVSSLIQKNKARCACSTWNNSFYFTMEAQLCNALEWYLRRYLQTHICTRVEIHKSFIKVGILDPSYAVVKSYLLRPDYKAGSIFRETSMLDHSETFLFIYPLPWPAHGMHKFFGNRNLKLCNKFKDSGDRVFFIARPTQEDPLNGLDCFLYELPTDTWFRVSDASSYQGHSNCFAVSATSTQIMETLDYAQLLLANVEGKDMCMELLQFIGCFPTYLEFCAAKKQFSTWFLSSFATLSEQREEVEFAQVSLVDA